MINGGQVFYQQQNGENYQRAVKEALGQDPTVPGKLEWLRKKWEKPLYQNSEAALIISPILFGKTRPIHMAIVADNLEYFRGQYEQELEGNYELALAEASLCGSRDVAEFLLQQLKSSFIADNHSDLLVYVAASNNTDWAIDIAREMAQAHITMPTTMYSIVDYKTIDNIISVFKNDNKPLKSLITPVK